MPLTVWGLPSEFLPELSTEIMFSFFMRAWFIFHARLIFPNGGVLWTVELHGKTLGGGSNFLEELHGKTNSSKSSSKRSILNPNGFFSRCGVQFSRIFARLSPPLSQVFSFIFSFLLFFLISWITAIKFMDPRGMLDERRKDWRIDSQSFYFLFLEAFFLIGE